MRNTLLLLFTLLFLAGCTTYEIPRDELLAQLETGDGQKSLIHKISVTSSRMDRFWLYPNKMTTIRCLMNDGTKEDALVRTLSLREGKLFGAKPGILTAARPIPLSAIQQILVHPEGAKLEKKWD